jgi:hypothetical protein
MRPRWHETDVFDLHGGKNRIGNGRAKAATVDAPLDVTRRS